MTATDGPSLASSVSTLQSSIEHGLLDMMNTHLSTTSTELVARLNKDWDGDVKAFDAAYDHILHMSDALSDGIVKQFPDKFGGTVGTTGRR